VIRNDILGRILAMKPEVYAGHRLTEILPGRIRMVRCDGETVEAAVDSVVLSLGIRSTCNITEAFEAAFDRVIPVADAAVPGRIYEATKDAFDRAYHFE
jgi:hypothetical protein